MKKWSPAERSSRPKKQPTRKWCDDAVKQISDVRLTEALTGQRHWARGPFESHFDAFKSALRGPKR